MFCCKIVFGELTHFCLLFDYVVVCFLFKMQFDLDFSSVAITIQISEMKLLKTQTEKGTERAIL